MLPVPDHRCHVAVIEPLLPARDPRRDGRPRVYGDRLVLDAIFYVLRSGCQWRMIPHDLVPWWTAYRWYRTWLADGTWDAVYDGLRGLGPGCCGPGSRSLGSGAGCPVGQKQRGGPARGVDMGKKITGRKRHLFTDTPGLVLVAPVTAVSVQDVELHGRTVRQRSVARTVSSLTWAGSGARCESGQAGLEQIEGVVHERGEVQLHLGGDRDPLH
jgi:transposase